MASTEKVAPGAIEADDPAKSPQQQSLSASSDADQSKPSNEAVEMTQLSAQQSPHIDAVKEPVSTPAEAQLQIPDTSTPTQPTESEPLPSSTSVEPKASQNETTESALGPEGAALPAHQADSTEAVLRITLMLTTGSRHPYLITSKYLAARKVEALDANGVFDPREMSAYKLKELIWTDWRPEWEPRPRDPAAIRLIILGRMLDDKSQLKESPFSLVEPNVVHMTVKPADLLDDDAEGASKGISKSLRGRSVDDGESAGCCRCIIQ